MWEPVQWEGSPLRLRLTWCWASLINQVPSTSLISAEPPNNAFRKVIESRLYGCENWDTWNQVSCLRSHSQQSGKAGFKPRSACLQFSAPTLLLCSCLLFPYSLIVRSKYIRLKKKGKMPIDSLNLENPDSHRSIVTNNNSFVFLYCIFFLSIKCTWTFCSTVESLIIYITQSYQEKH